MEKRKAKKVEKQQNKEREMGIGVDLTASGGAPEASEQRRQ